MSAVLVTGATGRVGGLVAEALAARGVRPRVLVRDPASASLPHGCEVCVGDFDDENSLLGALDGVEAAFLVSPVHPQQRQWQGRFARVAAAAGAPRMVKLSGLATSVDSFVDSGRWHAETEQDIRDLGLPYTFLRPYFFMQNLAPQLGSAARDGVIRVATPDAPIAMVDTRDIADVAVAALLGEKQELLADQAVPVTGAEAVTYRGVGAVFSQALGRTVRVEEQTTEQRRAALSHMPDWHRRILMQFSRAFAEGLAGTVAPTVQLCAGHAPRTLSEFVAERAPGLDLSSGP